MPIDYLNEQSWTEWSREERLFCAVLYEYARKNPQLFAKLVISTAKLVDVQIEGTWDVGYEVCFYRDYFKRRKDGDPAIESAREGKYPFKRTFDLCLFGERTIIIIEAKVCEGFSGSQNEAFRQDIAYIRQALRRPELPVYVIALAPGPYLASPRNQLDSLFAGKLTWHEAAAFVAANYGRERILERADSMSGC